MESTFGERFAFARWWQTGVVRNESDDAFGKAIGITQAGVSELRGYRTYNNATRGRDIAQRTGVGFEWLMWAEGEAPQHFAQFVVTHRAWLAETEARRAAKKATSAKAPTKTGFPREPERPVRTPAEVREDRARRETAKQKPAPKRGRA